MKLRANKRIFQRAFSLLEVMIAVSIFFMATFAILGLTTRCLSQARSLQPMEIDSSALAAEISLTNRLEEGPIPDDVIRNFEHMYPNYTCGGFIEAMNTNGLFKVHLEVGGVNAGKHVIRSQNEILLFREPVQSGFGPTPIAPGARR